MIKIENKLFVFVKDKSLAEKLESKLELITHDENGYYFLNNLENFDLEDFSDEEIIFTDSMDI